MRKKFTNKKVCQTFFSLESFVCYSKPVSYDNKDELYSSNAVETQVCLPFKHTVNTVYFVICFTVKFLLKFRHLSQPYCVLSREMPLLCQSHVYTKSMLYVCVCVCVLSNKPALIFT